MGGKQLIFYLHLQVQENKKKSNKIVSDNILACLNRYGFNIVTLLTPRRMIKDQENHKYTEPLHIS